MTPFEWLIARRYLFNRERKALISLISLISVGGVAVGVAALLIVIGVIDGIDELLFTSYSEVTPHVRIRGADGHPMSIDPALLARVKARPEVDQAAPVIEKEAILTHNANGQTASTGVRLLGLTRLGPGTLYPVINDYWNGGQVVIPDHSILVGAPVGYTLGLRRGEPVLLMTTRFIRTAISETPVSRNETVYGEFSTHLYEFDESTAFISEDEARYLYKMSPGTFDYIHVKLKDPFKADEVKTALNLPADKYQVTTWAEENGEFFGALKLEKLGMRLSLLLVILVAALNIIGMLILMVIEKTREVGILRAIGASERLIARIFLLDGMMIGLFGTLAGLVIGISVCLAIPHIPLRMPDAIMFDHLPVKIRFLSVTLAVAASMAISTLAALFPARQAAKLNPVEALRYD